MTWNPADASASLSFSNGNNTFTSSVNAYAGVRSTDSHATGLWYFEIAACSVAAANNGMGVGNSSFIYTNYLGSGNPSNAIGYFQNGEFDLNGSGALLGKPPYSANDIIGLAVDLTNNKFWVKNVTTASGWNNDILANQDPANNIGGQSIAGITGPFFIGYNPDVSGASATLNATGPFTGTAPSGFAAWTATAQTYIDYGRWPEPVRRRPVAAELLVQPVFQPPAPTVTGYRVKPPAIVPALNWQSSWLDRIAFLCFCNESGGSITELVTGQPLLPVFQPAAKAVTPWGLAAKFTGNYKQEAAVSPFVGPAGTQTGDFTMLCFANPQTGAAGSFIGCEDNPANSGVVLYANQNNFSTSSGFLQLSMFHAGGGETLNIAGLIDNAYHVYIVRRQAGTATVFLDGVPKGTIASVTDIAIPTGKLGLGGVSNQSFLTGNIVFAAGWNRALSDAEVATISRSLWEPMLADDWDVLSSAAPLPFVEWGSLADPVRRRPGAIEQLAQPPFIAPPNPLTTFPTWWQPFVDPVRRRPGAAADQVAQSFVVPANPDFGFAQWYTAFGDPMRRRAPAAADQSVQPFVAPGNPDFGLAQWFVPFRDPVRRLVVPASDPPPLVLTAVPLVGFPQWFAPWVDPIRRRAALAGDQPVLVLLIAANPLTSFPQWFTAWLDPVRRRVPAAQGGPAAASPGYPAPQIINCWVAPAPVVSAWTDIAKVRNTCGGA